MLRKKLPGRWSASRRKRSAGGPLVAARYEGAGRPHSAARDRHPARALLSARAGGKSGGCAQKTGKKRANFHAPPQEAHPQPAEKTQGPKWSRGPPPTRGPRARPEETWSLLEFIAFAPAASIPAERNISGCAQRLLGTNNKMIPGFGHLIRKGRPCGSMLRARGRDRRHRIFCTVKWTGVLNSTRVNDLLRCDRSARRAARNNTREDITQRAGA